MPAEFIYAAYKLARHYPPDRTVLEDISISFYPGAKIGVIGPNGAGKSSLLKIMAGLDDGFTGEARLTPGFTVGYLSHRARGGAGWIKRIKVPLSSITWPMIDAAQGGALETDVDGRVSGTVSAKWHPQPA